MFLNTINEKFAGADPKQAQLLMFLAKFNLFAVPLYAILLLDLSFVPLQALIANTELVLLNFAGYTPTINDLLISIPIKNGNWAAAINWDCTAWKSVFAFFALTMATYRSNKTKLRGLAVFLPLIFVVNLARIFFMFSYVRTFDVAYYELVHSVVWSWGMVFAVLAFWLVWLRRTNRSCFATSMCP